MHQFDTVLIIFSSIVSCCLICLVCFCICDECNHNEVTPEENIINNDSII